MQGTPEAHHVSRVYSVAVSLRLQFAVHVMLFPMTNNTTFALVLSSSSSAYFYYR
jgi:hypothetical protein